MTELIQNKNSNVMKNENSTSLLKKSFKANLSDTEDEFINNTKLVV